jgi:hypothetical protein
LKRDPTFFSAINQHYQTIMQYLFKCTEDALPEGVFPKDLDNFKSVYLDTAFVCRFRDCARHSEGFDSLVRRDEHEASHTKPLRCADASCKSFSAGFTSKKALDNHNRKHHPSTDQVELPKFEPRQADEPQRYIASVAQLPPLNEISFGGSVETTRRKSRAKRGLRVHSCDVCGKVISPMAL